jgi:YaiO family outer membrane protein
MSIRSRILTGLAVAVLSAACAQAQSGSVWTLDADVGHAALSRTALEDWSSAGLQAGRRDPQGRLVWSRVEWARRFGADDGFVQIGLQDRIAGGVGSVAVGTALGGAFREDIGLQLSWTRSVWRPDLGAGGTDFDLSARFADYGEGVITVLAPGLVHYFRDRDAWVSAAPILVRGTDGSWEGGFAVRGDIAAGGPWRVRGGLGQAPEVEAGRVARTRSLELGLRRTFGTTREVGWTLTRTDRSGSYARTGFVLSLRQRF